MYIVVTDLRAVHDGNEAKQPTTAETTEDGQSHVALWHHSNTVLYGRWLSVHHLKAKRSSMVML